MRALKCRHCVRSLFYQGLLIAKNIKNWIEFFGVCGHDVALPEGERGSILGVLGDQEVLMELVTKTVCSQTSF